MDDSYRYTFGGKEEQPELGLNWMDFHARNYDAALGRTMTMDPLADKFVTLSPYSFLNNNPLRTIDPTGAAAIEFTGATAQDFFNRLKNEINSKRDKEREEEEENEEEEVDFEGILGNGGDGSNNNDSMNRPIPIGDYSRGSSRGSAPKKVEYLQLETNFKPLGNPGALEYISGGGIIKGFNLLKNAGLAGWIKRLSSGGKAAKGITNIPKSIHLGKQGKHILGHNNYQAGKSILSSNPNTLLEGFHAGKFKTLRTFDNKVIVDFGNNIGTFYQSGKAAGSTRFGTIHYGKSGTHIVPANPVQF